MKSKRQLHRQALPKRDTVLIAAKRLELSRDLELQQQGVLSVAEVRFIPQTVAQRAKLLRFK